MQIDHRKTGGKYWWIIMPVVLLFSACAPSTRLIEPVDRFEVNRYTGRWYEIARYPHRFEKDLSRVTATYTLNEDGSLDVVNRGYNEVSKEWKSARGKAYFKEEPTLGLLKVSFFWPFYGEYKVIRLDRKDYSYAVITSSTFKYLWILSREPQLSQEVLDGLLKEVEELGFDRSRIIMVDQSSPE
ncbi:lipocalin family protein [bacterium]|nr:lipocalin family protein [bacterium]